ncbi:NAD(P)/FAD-dependent oxidoreductase [Brevundimonas staleyi]|uniref:NAD(P)/FAD-dependent oxidoreductase n=1 Tax=Brevundimonas staleyi TaxID=74326 RepID=A0ABW0FXE1_9CAUL
MDHRIVIVGAGHAGGAAAIALRELGFAGEINLVGDETHLPYERPTLSKELLSGADSDPVHLADAERWKALDVRLTLGSEVTGIDRESRVVTLADGAALPFDTLILATGGRARRLDMPDHPRIHVLRTVDDARGLAAGAKPGAKAVIVGGGVIGLEAASTLVGMGLSATVLEAGDRLLGRNIPAEAAQWLADAHARIGVQVRLGRSVVSVMETGEALTVALDDGSTLDADLMVVGIGIVPCAEIAETAGLPVAGGVLVDANYRSLADDRIFAIGDLAVRTFGDEPTPRRMETWAHAQTSARAAALAILSRPAEPEPAPWFWTAQCGHMLQIVGDPAAGNTVVTRGDGVRLYVRNDILVGAVCLDQARDFGTAKRMIGKPLKLDAAADPSMDLRKAAA